MLKYNGFADLVDFERGEVYEVKTEREYKGYRSEVLAQVNGYVQGLNDAAIRSPNSPYYRPGPLTNGWRRGDSFLTGTQDFGLWPYGIDLTYQPSVSGYFAIKARRAENGVIIYWGERVSDKEARRRVPFYAPSKVTDFIDKEYQSDRKPNWAGRKPQLYPGLNVYDVGYWCATTADVLGWALDGLGRFGEQLKPVNSGIPGVPGPGFVPIPVVP